MNGIPIGIDPVLIHFGGVEIRWYGLAIALGVIAAVWVATREARRKGLSEDSIQTLALVGVIGGIVGSRLFHVIDKLGYYMDHPAQIFAFQQGGLAIWGGVAGGLIAGSAYVLIKRIPLGAAADLAAPALLTGQIIGRIGCTINGDAWGGPTSLPWGFIYQRTDTLINDLYKPVYDKVTGAIIQPGVPTHPYPIYEMLWNLVLLAGIWLLRKRLRRNGVLFALYVGGYSLGRFLLTFVREEQIIGWGLQQAQVVALAGMVLATLLGLYLLVIRPVPVPATKAKA
ncbi:MAG: prolipoprotein diacylglyceryl transferase [Chloroflexi bacterium]|nr:prolipoprotein diacylglyceryl transferase [Chloroflexota bacterium]